MKERLKEQLFPCLLAFSVSLLTAKTALQFTALLSIALFSAALILLSHRTERILFFTALAFIAHAYGITEIAAFSTVCASTEIVQERLTPHFRQALLAVFFTFTASAFLQDLIFSLLPHVEVLFAEICVILALPVWESIRRLKGKKLLPSPSREEELSRIIEEKKKITLTELATIWTEENRQDGEENSKRLPVKAEEDRKKQPALEKEEVHFKNSFVQQIYSRYFQLLPSSEMKNVLLRLLLRLDEVADVPSVSTPDETGEYPENTYQLLSTVSLAEHTLNVCNEMIELLRDRYRDTWQVTLPRALLVCVAHDLGKAQKEEGQVLFYGEHAQRSASLFREIADGIEDADSLSDAIAFHHGKVPETVKENQLLFLLREADQRARRKEIEERKGKLLDWRKIDVRELCSALRERIEEEIVRGDVKACPVVVSAREGILFIILALFTHTVQELCREKQIFWPEIFSKDESEVAKAYVRFFREILSPANLIPAGKWAPPQGGFYRFYPVKAGRRNLGTRPFVVFILSTFCNLSGTDLHTFVRQFNESALSQIRIG